MQIKIAIFLGKLIALISQTFKLGGGSAAPGLYSLKIDSNLVEKLIKQIPHNIVITCTNGKTTTARLLAHFATQSGLKIIRNHTGSNLERGIASALIQNYRLHPWGVNPKFDLGIWELDEAAFNIMVKKIKREIILFLNVFRDQLDRYGEVDTVVKKWAETLKTLTPQTKVLVNGDDTNTAKLAKYFIGKVQKFGLQNYKLRGESIEKRGHNTKLDFEAKNIKLNGLKGSSFNLFLNHKSYILNLPLPGIYHIYDTVAAIAAFTCLFTDIPIHPLRRLSEASRYTNTLKSFLPAFGRVEKFSFQPLRLERKVEGYIFLIKNPAGATQVFETIAPQLRQNDRLLLTLNDNLADGTDVSWIWDAEFELLLMPLSFPRKRESNKQNIYGSPIKSGMTVVCSGSRTYDLAVRLKYAGFEIKEENIEADIEKALKQAQKGLKGRLFILPTYTAMLELQYILAKRGIKEDY